jgi:F-type H+-transporting ATPase subunit alpha
VLASDGDITAYLPTNIMSITDGQWILDMKVFRDTMRPAVSTGLSVTRVGGLGQNERQKQLAAQVVSALNTFSQAQEFAHFGNELALEAQRDLKLGKRIYELFNQAPDEVYSVNSQLLMLDVVMKLKDDQVLDVKTLKANVKAFSERLTDDKDFDKLREELTAACVQELKK